MLLHVNADGTHRNIWLAFPGGVGKNYTETHHVSSSFERPEGVSQKRELRENENFKGHGLLGIREKLNMRKGFKRRGTIWLRTVCWSQLTGFVYQAKESKLNPIINRKKQKTEKNIIKFIIIAQYLRTMGRKKAGSSTIKYENAQRLGSKMLSA